MNKLCTVYIFHCYPPPQKKKKSVLSNYLHANTSKLNSMSLFENCHFGPLFLTLFKKHFGIHLNILNKRKKGNKTKQTNKNKANQKKKKQTNEICICQQNKPHPPCHMILLSAHIWLYLPIPYDTVDDGQNKTRLLICRLD